jgi:hypothetical protein
MGVAVGLDVAVGVEGTVSVGAMADAMGIAIVADDVGAVIFALVQPEKVRQIAIQAMKIRSFLILIIISKG